ncbi:MAG: hypothetical protein J6R44_01215, partial [Clostridia bacterium]|nr:hypothetical protein [Clostridia bacterium]
MEKNNVRNNLNNEANQIANIGKINDFVKRNSAVVQEITAKLRALMDAKEENSAILASLYAEQKAREAQEEARLQAEREKAEAIKLATTTPIIEEPIQEEVKEEVVE